MGPTVPDLDHINFEQLAAKDLEFNVLWESLPKKLKKTLDWQDPEQLRTLTRALLRQHFNLRVGLPPDRLTPAVPVRYKYIQWIQRLLDTTSGSFTTEHDTNRQISGLDVGVGASCIYPLLGCATHPTWRFYGTDIDAKAISTATANVSKNKLDPRIRLLFTTPDSPLFPLDTLGAESLDFTMCNPPFYASADERTASAAAKKRAPRAACTAADIEAITEGGEVAFALRMVEESRQLRDRVQWYTIQLGKDESVAAVVDELREAGCSNWAVGNLKPGHVTVRRALAWSWRDLRPPPVRFLQDMVTA